MSSTAPKSYAIELGRVRCREIIREMVSAPNKTERDLELGCVLYKGKLTKDGHAQIQRAPRYLTRDSSSRSGENQHRAYYLHRIAYVALYGVDIDPKNTASHLCGRGNCINPFHIWDEPISLNVARINCLGFVDCVRHARRLATLCTHNPVCVKKPIEATSCCLDALDELSPDDGPEDSPESNPLKAFDEFCNLDPEETDFPPSSAEQFDPNDEIASPEAAPAPPPTPNPTPIRPPSPRVFSPPAWIATDLRESQDTLSAFATDYTDDEEL